MQDTEEAEEISTPQLATQDGLQDTGEAEEISTPQLATQDDLQDTEEVTELPITQVSDDIHEEAKENSESQSTVPTADTLEESPEPEVVEDSDSTSDSEKGIKIIIELDVAENVNML